MRTLHDHQVAKIVARSEQKAQDTSTEEQRSDVVGMTVPWGCRHYTRTVPRLVPFPYWAIAGLFFKKDTFYR